MKRRPTDQKTPSLASPSKRTRTALIRTFPRAASDTDGDGDSTINLPRAPSLFSLLPSVSGNETNGKSSLAIPVDDTSSSSSSTSLSSSTPSSPSSPRSKSVGDGSDRESINCPRLLDIEPIPVLAQARPRIHRVAADSSILSRVASFLPQLKDANESLQRAAAVGGAKDLILDEVDDGEEEYIEMSLGLGVLEEKHGHSSDSSINSVEIDSGSTSEEEKKMKPSSAPSKETNILGELMREKTTSRKPTIEEMTH